MGKSVNYQHLFYFWNVVKEGSFTTASKKLGLAQPTISGQILTFEKAMGTSLLLRKGRHIALTETGHIVFNYAQKIFLLGDKMIDDLKYASYTDHHRLVLGCRSSLPSHIISKLTNYALVTIDDHRITFTVDTNEAILNGLTRNEVDVAITDEPRSYVNGMPVCVECLMESEISLFCHKVYHDAYSVNFQLQLERAPFILPTSNTRLRNIIEEWFTRLQVRPVIVSEIENFDLIISMAKKSPYLICAPTIMSNDLEEMIEFHEIQRIPDKTIRYYSITTKKQKDKDLLAYITKKCKSQYV